MNPAHSELAQILLQTKKIEQQLLRLEETLYSYGMLNPEQRQRVTESLVKIKDMLLLLRKKRLELNLIILEGKNDH